jgi:site-specific DNA-methyltransferase (adenine-specific)/adenine-specific DNA-methyltransferase
MPTLNWIGKDAVIRHHKEVPFRLLEPDAELSHGDGTEGNLIVQGDNLHALKALLPKYAGRVKCIYIDPPYNTGNEGWVYNDKVNSPEINKWLGQVVGKEAEDLSRHDKWLCMMYPRMVLLKQFLSEDGAIFVSIDDNEVASLRLLMDEIFGRGNFVANVIWEKADSPKMDALLFSTRHDHTLCFARSIDNFRVNRFKYQEGNLPTHYDKVDENGRSFYLKPLRAMGGQGETREARPKLHYALTAPDDTKVYPKLPNGGDGAWRWSKKKTEAESERIHWIETKAGWSAYFRIYADTSNGVPPETIFYNSVAGGSRQAQKEISEVVPEQKFSTPKPTRLIQRILQIATDKDSIILDSFAGSGTTGHAVLKQNAEDGGNRKFILVEMEENIATNITAERVRRVAGGYTDAKGKAVDGLGSGFQFCRLSAEPLFNEFGDIREDVRFAQLADFVWFAETGLGYTGAFDSPILGVHEGQAVYLLFNGILGDRRPQGGNILTQAILDSLPTHDGPKVIYAAATRLGAAALQRAGIIFKQTPYAIQV